MNTTWMKSLVVAMGLSLTGGAALAAGPGPAGHGQQVETRGPNGHDDDGWSRNDDKRGGRDNDRNDKVDVKLERLGKAKVAEGKALQAKAAKLTIKARMTRPTKTKLALLNQAKTMKLQGERLEREGQALIRRARS